MQYESTAMSNKCNNADFSPLIELKTNKDKCYDVDFTVNVTDTMLSKSPIKNESYISFRTRNIKI